MMALLAVCAGCGGDDAKATLTSAGTATTDTGSGGGNLDTLGSKDSGLKEVQILDTNNPGGFGIVCAKNDDCKSKGLSCYETNPATGAGICSTLCTTSADCPAGLYCNPQSGNLICTSPRFCNPCGQDADCWDLSPGANNDKSFCLSTSAGKYCSLHCALGDATCGAASTCKQSGSGIDDFACQPDAGTCKGDGSACSPCNGPGDCSGGLDCYYAASTGERFCAKPCTTGDAGSCGSGTLCTQPKGATKAYCLKNVGGAGVETCALGNKQYCESCKNNYECASSRCALKNGSSFCAHPTACTSNNDCPYGGEATFCVPSDNVGTICSPPISWGCMGFLACLGHPCGAEQTCVQGMCTGE
jgi:hypothetical protein